jgi:hypothetical protein
LTFVGCEVGFITCFYLKFVYRNFAIDCIVELIKLFHYRNLCSLLFLPSLLAYSNVVAGKKALQWTFMLLEELITRIIIRRILSIEILMHIIVRKAVEELDLATEMRHLGPLEDIITKVIKQEIEI